jgi:hypothetical protein
MAVVTDENVARRIARTVVSDIVMYNMKKVEDGIRNDNLFDLLKNEIEEGQSYYLSRISPELAETTNFFNQALIDVLVKPKGRIPSKAW